MQCLDMRNPVIATVLAIVVCVSAIVVAFD